MYLSPQTNLQNTIALHFISRDSFVEHTLCRQVPENFILATGYDFGCGYEVYYVLSGNSVFVYNNHPLRDCVSFVRSFKMPKEKLYTVVREDLKAVYNSFWTLYETVLSIPKAKPENLLKDKGVICTICTAKPIQK